MNLWIVALVIGVLVIAGVAFAMNVTTGTAKTTTGCGSASCDGKCTANSNCGSSSCTAATTGKCSCGK